MPITFAMQDDIGVFTTIGDVDFQQGVDVFKHGMSRMFSQLASVNALEARAFERLDAALLWLQL